MANSIATARTLIDNLLPDNVVKAISAKDVRDTVNAVLDLIVPKVGLITAQTSSVQSIGTVFQKLTGFTVKQSTGDSITPDLITQDITVSEAGFYIVTGKINMSFANNTLLTGALAINGTELGFQTELDGLGATKPVSLDVPAFFFQLPAGAVLSISIKVDSAANITLNNGYLQMQSVPFSVLDFVPEV